MLQCSVEDRNPRSISGLHIENKTKQKQNQVGSTEATETPEEEYSTVWTPGPGARPGPLAQGALPSLLLRSQPRRAGAHPVASCTGSDLRCPRSIPSPCQDTNAHTHLSRSRVGGGARPAWGCPSGAARGFCSGRTSSGSSSSSPSWRPELGKQCLKQAGNAAPFRRCPHRHPPRSTPAFREGAGHVPKPGAVRSGPRSAGCPMPPAEPMAPRLGAPCKAV